MRKHFIQRLDYVIIIFFLFIIVSDAIEKINTHTIKSCN